MKPTNPPVSRWLKTYTTGIFQHSGRKSLLLTGSKGRGKTVLLQALTRGLSLPGVLSQVTRGADGLPVRVDLVQPGGSRRCTVGRRTTGPMVPDKAAFDGCAVSLVREARLAPGEWAIVDEIGFLEECSHLYQRELEKLFDQKRVLAAIRKADTPFLARLRRREDCFLLDLDLVEEGQSR